MESRDLSIPIYAIGGIRVDDLKDLKATNIYGVALSSVILESEEPLQTIREIKEIFNKKQ